jgi:hypothetical protein
MGDDGTAESGCRVPARESVGVIGEFVEDIVPG